LQIDVHRHAGTQQQVVCKISFASGLIYIYNSNIQVVRSMQQQAQSRKAKLDFFEHFVP
jgi:hypothetical protein